MASSPKPPRPAVSPLMRQPRKKEEEEIPHEEQPESLQEESLAPEDSFVLLSSKIVDWVLRNRVVVGALIGAVILSAIGVGFWISHQQDVEDQVAGDVFKVVNGLVPDDAGAPDAEAASPAAYLEAGKELMAIAEAHGGTSSALLARLNAGSAFMEGGDATQAVAAFQSALKDAKEPTLRYYAYSGLAAAHGSVGNDAAAIEAYRAISDELDGVWKDVGLMGLGRSMEGQGKASEAADAYERLLKGAPYSAFADDARSRLALLRPGSDVLKEAAPEVAPEAAP